MPKKMALYRVGQVLEKYLERADICARIQEQKIIGSWESVVGKGIAEVTQAVRVRNRILQVKVTNSVWVQELQFHKALILKKLNDSIGVPGVQELWFFIGEKEPRTGSGDSRSEERRKICRELNRDEEARIEKEVRGLRDPEMREVLARLFSTALRWEKDPDGR